MADHDRGRGPHVGRTIWVSQSTLMYSVFYDIDFGSLPTSQGLSERQAILLRLDDLAVAACNFRGHNRNISVTVQDGSTEFYSGN